MSSTDWPMFLLLGQHSLPPNVVTSHFTSSPGHPTHSPATQPFTGHQREEAVLAPALVERKSLLQTHPLELLPFRLKPSRNNFQHQRPVSNDRSWAEPCPLLSACPRGRLVNLTLLRRKLVDSLTPSFAPPRRLKPDRWKRLLVPTRHVPTAKEAVLPDGTVSLRVSSLASSSASS